MQIRSVMQGEAHPRHSARSHVREGSSLRRCSWIQVVALFVSTLLGGCWLRPKATTCGAESDCPAVDATECSAAQLRTCLADEHGCRGHLETFLAACRRDGHALPVHVEGELSRFLACGIYGRGKKDTY